MRGLLLSDFFIALIISFSRFQIYSAFERLAIRNERRVKLPTAHFLLLIFLYREFYLIKHFFYGLPVGAGGIGVGVTKPGSVGAGGIEGAGVEGTPGKVRFPSLSILTCFAGSR